ncbi:MAG: hypothetical protein QNK34_11300 [Woeseiaceae bacterium]|nr:hypothetical protein [Woeseiaceae bacterium]
MTNHHGEVVAPQRVEIKSWWTAFMTGAIIGGGLAAAAGFITVMSNG